MDYFEWVKWEEERLLIEEVYVKCFEDDEIFYR